MLSDRTLEGTDLTLTTGDQVGTGTHWVTFEAHTPNGDSVAVRSPRGQIPESEYDRFDSLATQWQTVSTRDTVRTLLDWGTDPVPWVAVEHLPDELNALATGSSLEAAIDCDLETRVTLLADVCEAIRSYSRYGSTPYHLRLGPESVTFREESDGPTAVVGDWGISGLAADPPVTPYTAPEQLDGGDHAGRQTDVYRLGALGYHLISGSAPFTNADRSLSDTIRAGVGKVKFADVPENLVSVLRRAMALDPDDRHAGMYQLRRDVVDAKPRVSPEDRTTSVLPPVTGKSTEDEESSTEDETSEGDRPVSSDEDSPDKGTWGPQSLSLLAFGTYAMIGALVLIVLLAGAWGTMQFGFVDFGGGGGGVSVSGTVNGADGPLSANATVELEPAEGDAMDTTAEGGTFNFSDVPPGNYTLSVEADRFVYDNREIEVTEDGADEVTIEPDRGIVTGEVTADGNPVDATVELVDESGETVAETTDSEFELEAPVDGSYTLRVNAEGYDQVERSVGFGEESVALESSSETTETTGSLSGEVIDITSRDPIEGATVEAVDADFSATTDSNGTYEINEIPTGEYTIAVSADGYAATERTVEITTEGVVEEFEIGAPASVSGVVHVENNESNTLNNATLRLLDSDGEEVETVTTGSDGAYTFDSLEEGGYRIEVSREGYQNETVRPINLDPDQDLTRDISLSPA